MMVAAATVVGTKVIEFREPEEYTRGGEREKGGDLEGRKAGAIKEPTGSTMSIKHLRYEGT